MSTRSTIAKGAVAAVAGVATLAAAAMVPTLASAQSYGYYGQTQGQTYYDPCRRDQTNRSTAGALIGGAIGFVVRLGGRGLDWGELLGNAYVGALMGMPVGLLMGGAYAIGIPFLVDAVNTGS